MKYLLLVLFLLSSSVASDTFAQKSKAKTPAQSASLNGVKRLDTLTIGGLRPGDLVAAFQRVPFKLDTVFWQGRMGANMIKGNLTQFGHPGECRISTREGEIQQVAFNMAFADSTKALGVFNTLKKQFNKDFGDPDEEYHNVHMMTRWNGDKRVLSLKGMDGANTLSVTLTPVVKPAAAPAPGGALAPTRKR